jgi:plasmid stabilization system protein ParE
LFLLKLRKISKAFGTSFAVDSPQAADRVTSELFEAFQQLAAWPGMGHTRRDLTERDVRFLAVGSYLVVYREHPLPLQIVAVLHGARDVPSIIG